MPSNKTHIVAIALVVLSLLLVVGCCREQYTYQHSTVTTENAKIIDTYLYKGIKTYYYDTTVIILNEIGDTLKKEHNTHREIERDQEKETKRDSVYIQEIDTVYLEQSVVVTNKMNKGQRFFFWIGVIVVLVLVGWACFKIIKIFK